MDNLGRQKPCSKDQYPWASDRDPLVKPAELVLAFIMIKCSLVIRIGF